MKIEDMSSGELFVFAKMIHEFDEKLPLLRSTEEFRELLKFAKENIQKQYEDSMRRIEMFEVLLNKIETGEYQ